MSTVKGLLKGLRYISQIFEHEKEEEMQIGLPTDVKHVAHIGNEGANANNPSWMNKYQGEASSGQQNSNGKAQDNQTTKSSAKEPTTRSIEFNGASESPSRPSSGKTKQSKRQGHSSSSNTMGSPARDPFDKSRRHKNAGIESPGRQQKYSSSLGSESPSRDPNVAPKPGRKKKTKGTLSGQGSTRSRPIMLEPQDQDYGYTDPGPAYDRDSGDMCQKSINDKYDNGKDCDEISRGIRAL